MPALTIGLTGGVASGKSLVADGFAALGVPVLDADQVAREVVTPGSPALQEIRRSFGGEYLQDDGQLNRRRMRELVFTDATARSRLEAITHPHIRARMLEWRDAQTADYCILSVAILIEARMHDLVDRILVVDVSEEVQRTRLCARDAIDAALAQRMLEAQASRGERLAAAHDVLMNDATPADALHAVAELHSFYQEIARRGEIGAPGRRLGGN